MGREYTTQNQLIKKSNDKICKREDCVCYYPKAMKPKNNCRGLVYVGEKCNFYKKGEM